MKGFNAKIDTNEIVRFLRNWFNQFGDKSTAVIGISGGKDSTVAAALLVKAIGKDRVLGIMMPNGVQSDISDSEKVIKTLGIKSKLINIKDAYDAEIKSLKATNKNTQMLINLAPRIRMTTLYAEAQNLPEGTPGFVINTCNLSEDYVGYSTKWGDNTGDVSTFRLYTVAEILQIGDYLGLPHELVHKTPSDGLCGKTDEDNLGFTYANLDAYLEWKEECKYHVPIWAIDNPNPISAEITNRIEKKHRQNLHKELNIPTYDREANRDLVVVDMQNDFLTGSLANKDAVAIVPHIKELIEGYRWKSVYFTADTHYLQDYDDTIEGKKLPVKHCILGTQGHNIVQDLKIINWQKNANIGNIQLITKETFGSKELADTIFAEKDAIKEIMFVGTCTDICVISNAMIVKAYLPNHNIVVDEAGCAGTTKENHQNAINAMKMCHIDII